MYMALFAITLDPKIDSVTHYVLKQEYSRASEFANSIEEEYTREYAHLFIKNSQIVDYESFAVDGHSFEKSGNSYINKIGKKWKSSDRLAYFKSMVKGMVGMSMIKRGSSLPGAMESKSSAKELEKLLKKYPTNTSLLQSVGLSKYYMATSLSWLPIAGGKPESGLKLLRKALIQDDIDRYLTKQSMLWVYIDEKQYVRAVNTAESILHTYPNNTLALRGLLQALYKNGDYDRALETAKRVQGIAESRTPNNPSDQLSSYVIQINIMKKQGNKSEALALCRKALAIPLSGREQKITWVQKHIKTIKKLSKELR